MEVILTEQFKQDLLDKVYSRKLYYQIMKLVKETIFHIPTIGNRNLPESIERAFGKTVRTLPIESFVIVYEYDEEQNIAYVYGLIHSRQAY